MGGFVWEDLYGRICMGGFVWEDLYERICIGGFLQEENYDILTMTRFAIEKISIWKNVLSESLVDRKFGVVVVGEMEEEGIEDHLDGRWRRGRVNEKGGEGGG